MKKYVLLAILGLAFSGCSHLQRNPSSAKGQCVTDNLEKSNKKITDINSGNDHLFDTKKVSPEELISKYPKIFKALLKLGIPIINSKNYSLISKYDDERAMASVRDGDEVDTGLNAIYKSGMLPYNHFLNLYRDETIVPTEAASRAEIKFIDLGSDHFEDIIMMTFLDKTKENLHVEVPVMSVTDLKDGPYISDRFVLAMDGKLLKKPSSPNCNKY